MTGRPARCFAGFDFRSGPSTLALGAALVLCACATSAPVATEVIEVAITIDDLPKHGPLIEGVTRVGLVKRMLADFERHHLPPVHGFVNGARLHEDPSTQAVLDEWVARGQPLGNHGYSHANPNTTPLPQYLSDIEKNEASFSQVGQRYYRYPFLYEGQDEATRTAVRAYLTEHHYAIAHVSIDGDDWAFNGPYARCTDAAQREALRKEFVQVQLDELLAMHALTKQLMGRAVPQVLLLHFGIADVEAMNDLLTAYEKAGVKWVDLPTALRDPFYSLETAPAKYGAALPYRVAKARGIKTGPPIYGRALEARLEAMCVTAKATPTPAAP